MDGGRAANNAKTKKSLFRGVLDGFRSTVAGGGGSASAAQRPDLGIEETLGSDHFQVTKVRLPCASSSVPDSTVIRLPSITA